MSAAGGEGAEALARLLERLDLERLDQDLFLGDPGPGEGRLFGGLVAAQSVVAAGRTVADGGLLHSLHAYFLRPGRHDVPIRFVVHRIRDGRTFTTRRVVAHYSGEAIFNLSASFTRPEEGVSHQDRMPAAPGPGELPGWAELRARHGRPDMPWHADAIELRVCDPDEFEPGKPSRAMRQFWMRPSATLPEDGLVHAAALVYASDRMLLGTVARVHGLGFGQMMGASLDHAMWLHRAPRFDGWILYCAESPVSHSARGLIFGSMWSHDGARIASVAQEGLVRIPRKR